ncbi:MAG: DegT/DnrJ/EryC1/StrS family aminotransferase [Lachnospiraceae bacterium]|jgi:UDP-2-acetamido-2-deoxy-ribo-hexuluronate aminotransferase|nr:DegT/DnrJ/EryC1/StrS family aminotransferase [Lachnospiraceae bacterium]
MEFRDLKRQYNRLHIPINEKIAEVMTSAHFISGEAVTVLEQDLAVYVGAKHCISCGNGTDAITIALMAYGVGIGDAVFVPDFTFFSSGECPATVGATPVFVDVRRDTYNMDPRSLERAIERVKSEGKLQPRAVVSVDLFGLPADYDAIRTVCNRYGLLLLEDGAQGFGGKIGTRKCCSFGDISTTSFFPAKPLGCYGDGGAIFTNDDEIADLCRSIAVHGKNADDKYDNVRLGMNSRLDTLQAAILLPKFDAFKEYELEAVNRGANQYTDLLTELDGVILPTVAEGFYSSWAQYTVQLPDWVDRDAVQQCMKADGIPTMVYYRKPMHRQGAFADTESEVADCPVTEELCERVLCLPIHPYLEEREIKMVVQGLRKALSFKYHP